MDTSDIQSFMQLFDRMAADTSLKGAGKQLACIAKLIFYCGVREAEIPELTIRDVIDRDGKIIMVIRKFRKPILLTDEIERCIAKFIDEMNTRNPSLVKRKSPLFPSYRNTRKIKRHLKNFETTHTQIHHAGIHYYYRMGLKEGRSKGSFYENGSKQKRISMRQFQAIALNSKIPAGVSVDNRCVDEIIRIFDAAERLDKNDPDAKKVSVNLIEKYKNVLSRFRSKNLKKIYDNGLSRLESMLP
jgi:hypothetical protein